MTAEAHTIGKHEVHPDRCVVVLDGVERKLRPRSMDVLMLLLEREGSVVCNDELLDRFWRSEITPSNAVYKVIAELREALGDDPRSQTLIQTIPKRGYRLVIRSIAETHSRGSNAAFWLRRLAMPAVLGLMLTLPSSYNATNATTKTDRAYPSSVGLHPFTVIGNQSANEFVVGFQAALHEALAQVGCFESVQDDHQLRCLWVRELRANQDGSHVSVDFVLDGNVIRQGEKVRVTLKLARTSDDDTVYVDQLDADESDLLNAQQTTASLAARAVAVYVRRDRLAAFHASGTSNVQAFLAAEDATSADQATAARLYHHALEIAPDYRAIYWRYALALDLARQIQHPDEDARVRVWMDQLASLAARYMRGTETERWIRIIRTAASGDPVDLEQQLYDAIRRNSPLPVDQMYVNLLRGAKQYELAAEFLERLPEDQRAILEPMVAFGVKGSAAALQLHRQYLLQHQLFHVAHLGGAIWLATALRRYMVAEHYLRELEAHGEEAASLAHGLRYALAIRKGLMKPGTDAFRSAITDPILPNLSRGELSFMVGDVASGIAYWSDLNGAERGALASSLDYHELLFSRGVVNRPSYQALLEKLGIGESWRSYLGERAAKLAHEIGLDADPPEHSLVGR